MAFVVERQVAAPAALAFAAVADFAAHAKAIPWTRIHPGPGEPSVGWRFTARSGPSTVPLVDEMALTRWDPPHGYALTKLGPVLRGWADITVTETAGGSQVRWAEEIRPNAGGRLPGVAWISDRLGRAMVERALDVLLAGVARG